MHQVDLKEMPILSRERARAPNHCGALFFCAPDGRGHAPKFGEIVSAVEDRLPDATALRQRVMPSPLNLDPPYWVDDADFDLEFHVRPMWLPKSAGWNELNAAVSRIMSRPLDLRRPPWEMYVIEGLDDVSGVGPAASGVLIKIHHIAVDAQHGLELLNMLTSVDPSVSRRVPAHVEWSPRPLPSAWALLRNYLSRLPAQLFDPLMPIRRGVPALARMGGRLLGTESRGSTNPRTRFSAPIGPHRIVHAVTFDFGGVRQVRHAFRTVAPDLNINDIALTLIGGALRRYLIAHDELPDQPLVAALPIALRSPDEMGAGGEQVDGARIDLHTDVVDDVERLIGISAATDEIATMHAGARPDHLAAVAEVLPGKPLGTCLRSAGGWAAGNAAEHAVSTTVVCTPGPRVPLYFLGREVVWWQGIGAVLDGTGPVHVVTSYRDAFTISVIADRDVMPDAWFYARCLQDAFTGLAGDAEDLAVT